MATHCSILAWEIPWTEKPGRVQSLGLQRVRHNSAIKQQQCSNDTRQQGAVVLICISLMISDTFMRTFRVHVGHLYSFPGEKKSLFITTAIFNRVVGISILSCINFLYIFDINPLLVILFTNVFSHSVGCLFALLIVFFHCKRHFTFLSWCASLPCFYLK